MTTLKTTFHDIKADFKRRVKLEGEEHFGLLNKLVLLIKPGFVGVVCYRLSHYLIETRISVLCRLLHAINFFYARVEIDPEAHIGPGLVLSDIGGIGIPDAVVIGKNCTFLGFNTLTLNKVGDVDFHYAQIVLGDHCVLGVRSKVMRPITIADGAQIKDGSVVMFPVAKTGTTLSGIPAKKRQIDDYENIINWNPLMGGPLGERN